MERLGRWLSAPTWPIPPETRMDLDERVEAVEQRVDALVHRVDVLEHDSEAPGDEGRQMRKQPPR